MAAAGTGAVPSSSHICCCRCWRVRRGPSRRFWNTGSRRWSGPGSSSSRLKEDPCKLSVLQCQQTPPAEWGGLGATAQPAYTMFNWDFFSSFIVLKILTFSSSSKLSAAPSKFSLHTGGTSWTVRSKTQVRLLVPDAHVSYWIMINPPPFFDASALTYL